MFIRKTAQPAEQMHCRDRRDLPIALVELKVTKARGENAAFTFKGYGSVWNRTDSYGDTVLKGAFIESLKNRLPSMLYQHRMDRVPGKWIAAEEDDKGLLLTGELTPGHSEAADLEASLRHGSITGLSIGGYTKEADWIEEDGQLTGRRIKAFDLYEVSAVVLPAESEARIDSSTVKSALASCNTIRELELFLREEKGFSRTAAEALVSRVKALTQGDPANVTPSKGLGELADSIKGIAIPTSLLGALR